MADIKLASELAMQQGQLWALAWYDMIWQSLPEEKSAPFNLLGGKFGAKVKQTRLFLLLFVLLMRDEILIKSPLFFQISKN